MDCGPTCLRMIAAYWGKRFSLEYLREQSCISRDGVNLLGISEAATKIGLHSIAVKASYEQLRDEAPAPCILHWRQNHFVVFLGVRRRRWNPLNWLLKRDPDMVMIADPGFGKVSLPKEKFLSNWISTSSDKGVALLLEPTPEFHEQPGNTAVTNKATKGFRFLFGYLKPYKAFLVQLVLGMLLAGFLNLLFPVLTQKMVDKGINGKDMGFVYMVLLSQLFLFVGGIVIDVIRSWILLHMNTRINLTIISDFLVKLMRLPIKFFDTKLMSDIATRVEDHHRIEHFLTSSSLNTVFSLITFLVFASFLLGYSVKIFAVFLAGSCLSVLWILLFLRRRRQVDYNKFDLMSENRNSIFEVIGGMQEIKLNNCEDYKRWEWEKIQARLFSVNRDSLALEQYQQIGSSFLTQLKNISVSFIAATEVISGNITLGVMLSVSYIVGQMNGPIEQLIAFFRAGQDARISLDRLGEIHNKPDEDEPAPGNVQLPYFDFKKDFDGIVLRDVSFRYNSLYAPYVLKDLNLTIPRGKITAIVGSSGSGKTTLMKLLLKFYDPQRGSISIGNAGFRDIRPDTWRKACGVVMQDGYIFSDTIARNIAMSDEVIDEDRLVNAARIANIYDHIVTLPLEFNTRIGNAGSGLSVGQEQRILIARAVYKNPELLFFDEATSALDANNEHIIMNNLNEFFTGKTVFVIAHRLSTVKNADQIVVLENGNIVEIGTHEELAGSRGYYFNLVKNQLELGQ